MQPQKNEIVKLKFRSTNCYKNRFANFMEEEVSLKCKVSILNFI